MTRDTGHRVTLPLVWRSFEAGRGAHLSVGPIRCGEVYREYRMRKWDAKVFPVMNGGFRIGGIGRFPTRAAAEAAVMAALGERREG